MKNIYIKFGAWISTMPLLLLPAAAMAQLSQADDKLLAVGQTLGAEALGNPLPELIGDIINVLLSILGIIFVVLVVYAGFLYLTDMGGGDKVKKAKDILGKSILGLVIIIAAYAISNYIISALVDVAAT